MRALVSIAMAAVACRAAAPRSVSGSVPASGSVPVPESVPVSESEPVPESESESVPVPALYVALFRDGAHYDYFIDAGRDHGSMTCTVSDVVHAARTTEAQLTCKDDRGQLLPPGQGWPTGRYVATPDGLFRVDLAATPEALWMTPHGEPRSLGPLVIEPGDGGATCRDLDDDALLPSVCFRAGVGIVSGTLSRATIHGKPAAGFTLAHVRLTDGAPREIVADDPPLAITAVERHGTPDDSFQVVNVARAPLDLGDYLFGDHPGEYERLATFDAVTLAPGAHHVQAISRDRHGFRIADDETLVIYRAADLARVAAAPP